jgi:hypothetical protein
MAAGNLNKRLDQIDGYSKALVQAIRIMNQLRFILVPLLDNEDLQTNLEKLFKNTHGAHAYNHLIPLFSQDLVRECSRLFLDEHPKACSLVNIRRKVSDGPVLKELRTRFRHIPDSFKEDSIDFPGLTEDEARQFIENWKERDRLSYEKDFNSTWEGISAFVDSLEQDKVAEKIKTFRDKHHSHLEMLPLGEEPKLFDVENLGLKFDDIFEFIDRCTIVCFDLTRIVTGGVHSIEGFTEIHKKQGNDMWQVLTNSNGGNKINKKGIT